MEPHVPSTDELSQKPLLLEDLCSREYFCCGLFGCPHYFRRCKIVAPCCNEVFNCKHCHNEAKNSDKVNPADRHELRLQDVKRVICSLCSTEQDVQRMCINCGVCMGRYFCFKCKIFDDNLKKNQFHCDDCGLCRSKNGGKNNAFHCKKCGCCYSLKLKDNHPCRENALHMNCPICLEFLFDTPKPIGLMMCGHNMHADCFKEMLEHAQYACPVCSKTFCDMTRYWKELDEEIASMPMPHEYQDMKVWILCNDCVKTSEVSFHILGLKCRKCKSYNTRRTQTPPAASSSSRIE